MTTLKTQRGPWKIDLDFTATALHVRPRGDLVWHPLDEGCHCLPMVDTAELRDSDGDPIHLPLYLHVALDARDIRPPRPGCHGGPAWP